jgi:hypothetical protein
MERIPEVYRGLPAGAPKCSPALNREFDLFGQMRLCGRLRSTAADPINIP